MYFPCEFAVLYVDDIGGDVATTLCLYVQYVVRYNDTIIIIYLFSSYWWSTELQQSVW